MTYFGGKSSPGVPQTLINQIPPHHTFITAFSGHCAILAHKRPAHRSIALDMDPTALQHWIDHPIPGLELRHTNALTFLTHYFALDTYPPDQNTPENHSETFVYADPPYPHATRSSRTRYRYELSDADHAALCQILLRLPCPTMVSSYSNPLYNTAFAHWRTIQYDVMTRGGTTRQETVWMNYPHPTALHDYSYAGANKRARERIRRRTANWVRLIADMPPLQRGQVLQALAATYPTTNTVS